MIAEDSAILRDGLVQLLVDRGHEVVAAVGRRRRAARRGGRRPAGRVRDRHPDAAVVHRRGLARRDRVAALASRRRRAGLLAVRRDAVRRRVALRLAARSRVPAQGPRRRRPRVRRGAAAGGRRRDCAGPRGRLPAARCVAGDASALDADAARARGARNEWPKACRTAGIAAALVVLGRSGREAHREHLHQARPAPTETDNRRVLARLALSRRGARTRQGDCGASN